jgi:hypothetical protein
VLPEASTRQGPGTLARKLSRCKPACRQAGRVWHEFLPSRYKFYWVKARSWYKFYKWPESCLGCRELVNGHWCSGAVRICQVLLTCHGGRSKSKNRDKQLTHIVRVRCWCILFCLSLIKILMSQIVTSRLSLHLRIKH